MGASAGVAGRATVAWILLAAGSVAVSLTPAQAADYGQTGAIVEHGLIPGTEATPYTHPSDATQLRDGTLAVIYNGGPAEAQPGNKVYIIRKPPGEPWGKPGMVEDNPEGKALDVGVIYQPKKEGAPVLCYYWFGYIAPRPHNCTPVVRESRDGGLTWGPRITCPESPGGPPWTEYPNGKWLTGPLQCAPVELPDGSLIAGGHLQIQGARNFRAPVVRIPPDNYTGDQKGGKPWELLNLVQGSGLPGFLILSKDRRHIAMVGRGSLDGPHTILESKDAGRTWSAPKMLPKCGGAGVGCVSLDVDGGPAQGWHIAAGSGGGKGGRRNGLTVAISRTPLEPNSWIKALILNVDEGGEDADPTVIQAADRKVHIVYTGRTKGRGISHCVIDPDKLIQAQADAAAPN